METLQVFRKSQSWNLDLSLIGLLRSLMQQMTCCVPITCQILCQMPGRSEEEEATVLVLTDPRLAGRDEQVITIKTEEHRMGGTALRKTLEDGGGDTSAEGSADAKGEAQKKGECGEEEGVQSWSSPDYVCVRRERENRAVLEGKGGA